MQKIALLIFVFLAFPCLGGNRMSPLTSLSFTALALLGSSAPSLMSCVVLGKSGNCPVTRSLIGKWK